MVYSILKTTFVTIPPPKRVNYRDYRKFSEQEFINDFALSYNRCPPNSYEQFEKLVVTVLDKHAPLKTAIFRGNSKPHVDKNLKKAIMLRTRLKNIANRTKKGMKMYGSTKSNEMLFQS